MTNLVIETDKQATMSLSSILTEVKQTNNQNDFFCIFSPISFTILFWLDTE